MQTPGKLPDGTGTVYVMSGKVMNVPCARRVKRDDGVNVERYQLRTEYSVVN